MGTQEEEEKIPPEGSIAFVKWVTDKAEKDLGHFMESDTKSKLLRRTLS